MLGAWLGAIALAVALVALLLALGAQRRLRARGGDGAGGAASSRHESGVDDRVGELAAQLATVRADLAQGLRHVAVVRYDAFGDMGGRMSFSAALVDEHGDGMVISAIHARGESRTYAKGVTAGESDITLTPEERQALASARRGEAA